MKHPEPRLFDADFARRALVPILSRDSNRPIGTGFFVGPGGEVLTCYHVVAPHLKTGLEVWPYGAAAPVSVELVEACSAPDLDLAVLRGPAPPAVLPCGGKVEPGLAVWSTGFQHQSSAIVDALPTNGRVAGRLDQLQVFGTTLRGVYALEEATISPGLSGAPLLDRASGVVVGLVTAEFLDGRATVAGFALPLGAPAVCATPLDSLLAKNRDTVPAYGRHLNRPGALELCRRQREATLAEFRDIVFLPDKYCDRELEAQVEAFLIGPNRVLPIIGHSGVGKSSLLCALANRPDRPVLLVRANSADYGPNRGLSDVLENAFGKDRQFVHDLPTLLGAVGDGLIVLFDGLNEVTQFDLQAVKAWIEKTMPWLRQHRVRWVVTSRPEYWEHLKRSVGEDLLHRPPASAERRPLASPGDGIALTDFSDAEGSAGMASYGLAGRVPDSPLFRHPFMMRVCWETLKGGGLVRTGRYALLESFARQVCDRVAARPNVNSSGDDVFGLLREFGELASGRGTNSLGLDKVNQLLPRESPLRKALRDEHMLEPGANEFRFAFDEVAEFFIAQSRDASELTACPDLDAYLLALNHISAGALRLAVLRAERDDSPMALAAVNRVAAEAPVSGYEGPAFAVRLFADLADPVAQLGAMRTYCLRKVTECPDDLHASWMIAQEWARLNLPPEQKLELLRILCREERSYRFRQKDWKEWRAWRRQEPLGKQFDEFDDSFLSRVVDLIAAAPEVALDGLLGWLGDTARLREQEATVADAAAAFLHCYRDLFFDRLCDALVGSPHETAADLLAALVEAEPDQFVAILERWSTTPGVPDRLVLKWAGVVINTASTAREVALTPLLLRLHGRLPVGTPDYWRAVQVMVMCPTLRDGVYPAVAEGLRDEPPALPLGLLNLYRRTRLAEVLDLLDQFLNSDVTERQHEALTLLWRWREPEACAAAVERLERFVPCREELAIGVGLAIEHLLYEVPTALPERAALVRLAGRALTEAPQGCRRQITYFVVGDTDDPVKLREKAEFTKIALTVETDHDILRHFLKRMTCDSTNFGSLLEALQPLAKRIPPHDFDALIRPAVFNSRKHKDANYRVTIRAWAGGVAETMTTSPLRDLRQLLQQPGDLEQVILDYFTPFSPHWQ